MRTLPLLLLLGCGRPGPNVYIDPIFEQPDVPELFIADVRAGAALWSPIGVTLLTDQVDLPVCTDRWWTEDETPCMMPIRISVWPASQLSGYAGLTANRDTMLAQELWGDPLISTAAHEFGHSVFFTSDHDPPGAGIMSSPAIGITLSQADIDFAREHTR